MPTRAPGNCLVRSMRKPALSCLSGQCGLNRLLNRSPTAVHKRRNRSFDMGSMQNVVSGSQARLDGEFFKKLSPEALKDLSAMALPSSYPAGKIVYSERDLMPGIYIILEGEVKLSMNSSDGPRP